MECARLSLQYMELSGAVWGSSLVPSFCSGHSSLAPSFHLHHLLGSFDLGHSDWAIPLGSICLGHSAWVIPLASPCPHLEESKVEVRRRAVAVAHVQLLVHEVVVTHLRAQYFGFRVQALGLRV